MEKNNMTWEQFINNNKDRIDLVVNEFRNIAKTIPYQKSRQKYYSERMREFKQKLIKEFSTK